MYLFVFLWVPSLQEVGGSTLPLGYIFSAFMISMILGSIINTTVSAATKTQSIDTALPTNGHSNGHSAPQVAADSVVVLHAKLAALICGLAALLFAYSATGSSLSVEKRFWAFCAFEACVGAYYPVMGMLRGALVPNEVRATVRMIIHQPSIRHVLTIVHSCHRFLGFHSIFSSQWRCLLEYHLPVISFLLGVHFFLHWHPFLVRLFW
jgi:hypothetical protein